MELYNFHRSSASYRVRIALALKDLAYDYIPVRLDLDRKNADHLRESYREMNPQQLVPFLVDGDMRIGQTLAILDYLDRKEPEPPLFPTDDVGRARVLSLCLYIAAEIQPLGNLRVERYLREVVGMDDQGHLAWRQHWNGVGLQALETMLQEPATGRFCHGDEPTAADCYLVPQVTNALRAQVDLAAFPTVRKIHETCMALPAFSETAPEKMPDHRPMTGH